MRGLQAARLLALAPLALSASAGAETIKFQPGAMVAGDTPHAVVSEKADPLFEALQKGDIAAADAICRAEGRGQACEALVRLSEADQRLKSGDFRGAVASFEKGLGAVPGFPGIPDSAKALAYRGLRLNDLGAAYSAAGDPDGAKRAYCEALAAIERAAALPGQTSSTRDQATERQVRQSAEQGLKKLGKAGKDCGPTPVTS